MYSFNIDIELPLFLLIFREFSTSVIRQNLLVYRTCYITLGYDKSDCALLGNQGNTTLETLVQPTANYVSTLVNVSESLSMIIVGLFVGTWSDRFGRKPVLVITFLGLTITAALETLYSYLEDISAWYYIICTLPKIGVGGLYAFQTVSYSYLSDVTNDENRNIRMAILEGFSILGSFVGTPAGTYIYKATDYTTLFGISTIVALTGLLWNIFKLKESIEEPEKEGKIRGFFNFDRLKEITNTAVKGRERHKRSMILLVATAVSLNVLVMNGHLALQYNYLRRKLNWDITKYTLLSTANSFQMVVCSVFGTFLLTRLLRLDEIMSVCVGFVFLALGSLGIGLGTEDWQIFSTGTARSFFGLINPISTSFLTKIVGVEEIGSVISVTAVQKGLFQLVASPIYTAFYNATLEDNPGSFNFLSVGLLILGALILVYVRIMVIRYKPMKGATENHISTEEILKETRLSLNLN